MEALKIRREFKPYRMGRASGQADSSTARPPLNAVQEELDTMLSSTVFRRCKRLSGLLRYLVKKLSQGATGDLNEYGIGIEYYRRDPHCYNTTEDPIVRVQIGRLRDKLKQYYAGSGQQAPVRIAIPLGSYVPVIETTSRGHPVYRPNQPIVFMPLSCIGQDDESVVFTQGLNEELGHRLFTTFGDNVRSHWFSHATEAAAQATQPADSQPAWQQEGYWLEGGVRVEETHLRVSIRVIAAPAGCVVWSQQFERHAPLNIALQEALATEIGQAVKTYLIAR